MIPTPTLANNGSSVTDGFRCWVYPTPEQTQALLLATARNPLRFPWISPLVQCGKTNLGMDQLQRGDFDTADLERPRITNPINFINLNQTKNRK